MKKSYIMPAMQANEAQVQTMLTLSLFDSVADPNGDVLVKEDDNWEDWDDDED